MLTTLSDRFYGMEALALASLRERDGNRGDVTGLPPIAGIAEDDEAKLALARFWMRCWTGFGLTHSPGTWIDGSASEGYRIRSRKPKSKIDAVNKVITDKNARKAFWDHWHPVLLSKFTSSNAGGNRYLNGSELSLQFDGEWQGNRI